MREGTIAFRPVLRMQNAAIRALSDFGFLLQIAPGDNCEHRLVDFANLLFDGLFTDIPPIQHPLLSAASRPFLMVFVDRRTLAAVKIEGEAMDLHIIRSYDDLFRDVCPGEEKYSFTIPPPEEFLELRVEKLTGALVLVTVYHNRIYRAWRLQLKKGQLRPPKIIREWTHERDEYLNIRVGPDLYGGPFSLKKFAHFPAIEDTVSRHVFMSNGGHKTICIPPEGVTYAFLSYPMRHVYALKCYHGAASVFLEEYAGDASSQARNKSRSGFVFSGHLCCYRNYVLYMATLHT